MEMKFIEIKVTGDCEEHSEDSLNILIPLNSILEVYKDNQENKCYIRFPRPSDHREVILQEITERQYLMIHNSFTIPLHETEKE